MDKPRRPGQYTDEQFRWRAGVVGGLFLGAIVLAVAGFRWPLLSIAALALLLLLNHASDRGRRLDPFPWLAGRNGERRVANALDELIAEGFVALHDVDVGRGNVDHVVVGPTGVFAIETKNWHGRWYPKRRQLWHNDRDASAVVRQARRGALQIKDRVRAAGVPVSWIDAVVVAAKGTMSKRRMEFDGVAVVGIADLGSELLSRPVRLSGERIRTIVGAVSGPTRPRTVRSTLRQDRTQARRPGRPRPSVRNA